jgi:hypothetical protein
MDYTDETRTSRSVIVSKVLGFLQHVKSMILAEVKHRFSQLSDLGLFPSIVQRFLNIFSQTYVGNITIWPTPKLEDYLNILRMPSCSNELERFVEVGRQRTYPSTILSNQEISLIKATMHLEAEIEKCLKKAKYISQSRLNLAFRMSEASIAEKQSHEEYDQEVIQKVEQNRKMRIHRNASFMNPRELTHH